MNRKTASRMLSGAARLLRRAPQLADTRPRSASASTAACRRRAGDSNCVRSSCRPALGSWQAAPDIFDFHASHSLPPRSTRADSLVMQVSSRYPRRRCSRSRATARRRRAVRRLRVPRIVASFRPGTSLRRRPPRLRFSSVIRPGTRQPAPCPSPACIRRPRLRRLASARALPLVSALSARRRPTGHPLAAPPGAGLAAYFALLYDAGPIELVGLDNFARRPAPSRRRGQTRDCAPAPSRARSPAAVRQLRALELCARHCEGLVHGRACRGREPNRERRRTAPVTYRRSARVRTSGPSFACGWVPWMSP
jgi:hypothetical protein